MRECVWCEGVGAIARNFLLGLKRFVLSKCWGQSFCEQSSNHEIHENSYCLMKIASNAVHSLQL